MPDVLLPPTIHRNDFVATPHTHNFGTPQWAERAPPRSTTRTEPGRFLSAFGFGRTVCYWLCDWSGILPALTLPYFIFAVHIRTYTLIYVRSRYLRLSGFDTDGVRLGSRALHVMPTLLHGPKQYFRHAYARLNSPMR